MAAHPAPRFFYRDLRLGLLGGGQLGRMLLPVCHRYGVHTAVLDAESHAPAGALATRFDHGSFRDYDAVLAFGLTCDLVTIEIEHINLEAYRELERRGVRCFPQPDVLALIQDKGAQKQFYQEKGLPTAPFQLVEHPRQLDPASLRYPSILKTRTGGYDGKGVMKLSSPTDLYEAFDAPCVLEQCVDIDREIAVIVARSVTGEVAAFPPVEMAFHPTANLVELLFAPSTLTPEQAAEAEDIARRTAEALGIVGLLAVEMFLDREGRILINEVAPRPHNSGHHTIEANATSQYEQHLRAILGLPLGSTQPFAAAAMVNLLGEMGFSGRPVYEGLEEALALPGVHLHLYGKEETRPMRKMGHITVTAASRDEVIATARRVQQLVKVKAR